MIIQLRATLKGYNRLMLIKIDMLIILKPDRLFSHPASRILKLAIITKVNRVLPVFKKETIERKLT